VRPAVVFLAAASLLLGIAAPGAATSATAAPQDRAEAVEFVLGISTLVPQLLPVWAAQDQGFDTKNGLKISIVNTEGGSRGLLVLVGGGFHAMEVGLAPVVLANAAGADVRSIDSTANVIPFIVFGGLGVTADNAAQTLKGSTLGISTFGSESDVAATLFLNRLGLVRDSDVTVVQIGGTATRLAALESGAVGAVPLLGPEAVKATQEGFVPLLDLSQNSDWVFESIVLNKTYLDSHRDQALALLRAVVEGNSFSRSRPDEAKRILSSGLKYSEPTLIDASYEEYLRLVPLDLTPRETGIREVIRQVSQLPDSRVKTDDPAAYVDLSLVEQLRTDGFFEEMQRTYAVP
jgi:NitT/TauT family transport system substrate-binding protein